MKRRKFYRFSLKRGFAIIALALIVSVQFTNTASAVFDSRFYMSNGIREYRPDVGKCPVGGGGNMGGTEPGSIPGGKTYPENPPPEQWPKTVWDYLIQKKVGNDTLTPEQVAGIMGNIQTESTNYRNGTSHIGVPFNPDATEFPGENRGGYGLVQWTGGRRTALVNAAVGVSVGNIFFQLDFLWNEMNQRRALTYSGTEAEGLAAIKTKGEAGVVEATIFFHDNFERSSQSRAQVLATRAEHAKKWYNLLKNQGPGSSTGGCPTNTDASPLIKKVLEYAYPTYIPQTTVPLEAYAKAVDIAQGEQRYVGGGIHEGIDCGGFVTTLIYDSGFDKNYNSGAKGGNTGPQKAWLDANWTNLGDASAIDTGTLKAGDVAISTSHTFIYVGTNIGKGWEGKDFGGGDPAFSGVASASYGGTGAPWRAPMAGHESLASAGFTWYRKK